MDGSPRLRAIDVTDRPDLWAGLGFAVQGGRCLVGDVALRLGAPGRDGAPGLTSWVVDGAPGLTELPGGPTDATGATNLESAQRHPNGVVALDHVVVTTPDLDRTVAGFEAAGVALKRTRQAGPGLTQAFFRLGPVIIEVVGGSDTAGAGAAALWGLAFTVADLDATAAYLGDRLRPPRPAVQPGRRIATLDRAVGSAVPMVFMSGCS